MADRNAGPSPTDISGRGNAARQRPGGRAAKVVATVRAATLELLAERGYAGIEIPEIAERAGVNRTTIYRRWPSKADLVLDIMLAEMRDKVPTPDTGSFRGDLERLLTSIADVLAQPAALGSFQILAAQRDPNSDYADMRRQFWEERFAVSGAIVDRAVERGEIPAGVSPRAVLELGSAPLYFRILALGETVDPAAVSDIAGWVARQDFGQPAFRTPDAA